MTNFKLILKLITFCFLLVSYEPYKCQDLQKGRKTSYFTYVYKISNEEARNIYKNKNSELFIEKHLINPVDSFCSDSSKGENSITNKLPVGHYVFVKANSNQIEYNLIARSSFKASVYNDKKRIFLYLFQKENNLPIPNATVRLNGKLIKYDDKTRSYILPELKKDGFISIGTNNEENFYFLSSYQYDSYRKFSLKNLWYKIRYRMSRRNEDPSYSGYIAFNKPKYLPRDTVKLKAYIVDKKGVPIKEEVKLSLHERYERSRGFFTKIKPSSDGAYVYEFILSDSLEINNYYVLEILNTKNEKSMVENAFYLEDYQLDETSYQIRSDKEEYKRGETITFYAEGKDANGFNLLDARIEIVASIMDVDEFIGDKVFVPQRLFIHKKALDPIGETKIIIPDSIIPDASIHIRITATFNNSNNESHDTTFVINYIADKKSIDIKLAGPNIIANYLVNGKNTSKPALLIKESPDGTIRKFKVLLPFKETIDPTVETYGFDTDSLSEEFEVGEEKGNIPVSGRRTVDSVFIQIDNPRELDIIYSIFKDKVEIEKGTTKNLDWKIKDESDDSYSINYHFMWAGNTFDYSRNFALFEKDLHVTINQAKNVFPGEKTQVNIKVTDLKNEPVKDANVTALAINGQFDESNIPTLPYLGKLRYAYDLTGSSELEDSKDFVNGKLPLTENWRKRMKLDTITFYQMLYPKNGIHYNYDSVETINAQISPFLFRNGFQEPIYLVYIDNRLVYYHNTFNASSYVFISSPGYHFLKIRTYDKVYYIDSVLLKKGMKADLSIDVNKLPKNVKTLNTTAQLTDFEKEDLHNSILMVYTDAKHPTFVWEGNHVCELPRNNNYDNYNIYELCGFSPDTVQYAVQDEFYQKFVFEPGYLYTIKKSMVKMQEFKAINAKVELPRFVSERTMGQKAKPVNSILLKTPTFSYEKFITINPSYTEEGNGSYSFEYTGDSSICLLKISKIGNDSIKRFYGEKKRGKVFNLKPGYYNILFITENNNCMEFDSVKIMPNGTFFQRFGDTKYISLSKEDSLLYKVLNSGLVANLINPFRFRNFKNTGAIKVLLKDKENNEMIPFANVVVYENGVQVAVSTTNMDGEAIIKQIVPGRYDIKGVYVGYQASEMKGVLVQDGKTTYVTISLSNGEGVKLNEVEIVNYNIPFIDPDMKSGGTITREDFQMMATKNVNSIVGTSNGVYASNFTSYFASGSGDGAGGGVEIGSGPGSSPGSAQIIGDTQSKKFLRNKFSDYAYWKPNLITNERGEVSFNVSFPDNITNWKSYALVMNGNKQSGSGFAQTNSYKKIMANLSIPRFLVEGDSSYVVGKALNYSDSPVNIKTSFNVEGKIMNTKDTILKDAIIQSIPLFATLNDSVKVTFSMEQKDGQKDGEERVIPIYPKGSEETTGYFFALNNDTTITLELKDGQTEIYAQNDPFDFMLKELEQLQNYPYACMEQTASKLNGYLMEEKIKTVLNQKFTHTKEIKNLLRRLQKGQKDNGSWGWWEDSPENVWMTTYILEIISKAQNAGYDFDHREKSIEYLKLRLPFLKRNELLSALNALSELKAEVPLADYLAKLEKDTLTLTQRLTITLIKQKNRIESDVNFLAKEKKVTLFGNYYWGQESFDWYSNSTNATLLAYQVLEGKDSLDPFLPFIRNYFLEMKHEKKWKNTIETAKILETILPSILRGTGKIVPASLELKGEINETITNFPYKKQLDKIQRIAITKKGATPIYFTAFQKRWNTQPEKKEDYFSINTYYELKNKRTDSLKAGIPLDLVVEIQVKKKCEYVMIEVPIPSGCSYDNNTSNINYNEAHREYYKNKTNIFCEQLPQGKHIFKIKLQPRFRGSYTVNPTKTESMYFPVFYGRNGLKKVKIR